jgi:hypothetical protein
MAGMEKMIARLKPDNGLAISFEVGKLGNARTQSKSIFLHLSVPASSRNLASSFLACAVLKEGGSPANFDSI